MKTNPVAFQLDDEPKAATATWWQCTLITIEVRKKKAAFLHAALKLEYIGEHSIGWIQGKF